MPGAVVIAPGVPDPPAITAAEATTAAEAATAAEAPTAGAPATGTGAPVDQARFRQVLGHFATGVTVVTGRNPAGPVGLAVNSFTSVSLDPPLVAFSVNRRSTTWPLLRAAGRFTVNILGADQEAVCRRFASTGRERFEGVGWRPSPGGSPVLDGALAWIDALVEVEHDAGDHLLVVGRVTGLDVVREGAPLVFYRGGYGRFEL